MVGEKRDLYCPMSISLYIYQLSIYIYTYIHVYITNVWDGGDINYKCRYFISYGTDEIKILSIADRHLLSLGVFHRLLDVHLGRPEKWDGYWKRRYRVGFLWMQILKWHIVFTVTEQYWNRNTCCLKFCSPHLSVTCQIVSSIPKIMFSKIALATYFRGNWKVRHLDFPHFLQDNNMST